jgi:hypothetical protein
VSRCCLLLFCILAAGDKITSAPTNAPTGAPTSAPTAAPFASEGDAFVPAQPQPDFNAPAPSECDHLRSNLLFEHAVDRDTHFVFDYALFCSQQQHQSHRPLTQ